MTGTRRPPPLQLHGLGAFWTRPPALPVSSDAEVGSGRACRPAGPAAGQATASGGEPS